MKKLTYSLLILLSLCKTAYALDVGDITSFMHNDINKISKEIKNSTDSGRLITVKIERISSPLASGEVIAMESKDEMLLSPALLMLPSNSREIVSFFYNGPKDDKERYYRIVWTDRALTDASQSNSSKNAVATTSARIGTILVVSPRKDNFSYQFKDGVLTNTGNSSFKAIAYGTCNDVKKTTDCKENYFVLPGKSRQFTNVNTRDSKGYVAIWHGEQFIPVK